MSPAALSTLLAFAAASVVLAQPDPADPTPLYSKHYAYPSGISYQVDPVTSALRGPQVGYNICNSTTENQQSMCQTAFFDHIDDFCLWAPPKPNSTIGDTEGEEVAWCTKPGHGTRLIPEGALKGVQYLKAKHYVLIAGFIDQTQINMAAGDYGGELDPHGADLRGNPIGALAYSNYYPDGNTNNNSYVQISDWTLFMGGNAFCLKFCDPADQDPIEYCQNIYDRLGCAYNAPNNAQNGTFEVCDSDDIVPPGIYTGTNGQTSTYFQPAETVPITSVPYTPTVPASSNCVTYHSSDLYTGLPTPTGVTTTSAPSSSGAPRSSTAGSAAPTSNGASVVGISSVATVAGVVFAMVFLS